MLHESAAFGTIEPNVRRLPCTPRNNTDKPQSHHLEMTRAPRHNARDPHLQMAGTVVSQTHNTQSAGQATRDPTPDSSATENSRESATLLACGEPQQAAG